MSELGARGVSREQGEQAGNEMGKPNVILGFKVLTTCGRKNFDDYI